MINEPKDLFDFEPENEVDEESMDPAVVRKLEEAARRLDEEAARLNEAEKCARLSRP